MKYLKVSISSLCSNFSWRCKCWKN